jgi:hypothetical protein
MENAFQAELRCCMAFSSSREDYPMTNNHDDAGDATAKGQRNGPAHGLRGEDPRQGDPRDAQGGTYDRHDREGGRQGDQVKEKRTPHQDAQLGADVRSEPVPPSRDPLPEGLAHRAGPMNKSTGRRPFKG